MKVTNSGIYVNYNNKIFRMAKIRDPFKKIPIDYYIYVNEEEQDGKCVKWLDSIVRPITSKEIEYLYDLKHYIVFQGERYRGYSINSEKGTIQISVETERKDSYDSKYKQIAYARDDWQIVVPIDEVTLYETKTYYDKDKYINEDERIVLSEETYLIDEPYWLEE